MNPTRGPEPPAPSAPAAPNLKFRARLLLIFMLLLVCGSALYVLYARGVFESTQKLVLLADDSEGVVVGMDLTFAGFPIGRVRRIELAEDGKARILIDVAAGDARWLRASSIFTLSRGIVGGANLRAYSGVLEDPPLPDGAVRTVLQGDPGAEIHKAASSARELIENLNALTGSDGALGMTLANLRSVTARLNEMMKVRGGALAVLLGSEAEAKKLTVTLDRTNALLARLDGIAGRADIQVFGEAGVMPETRAAVVRLGALLDDARGTLKKVDAVLVDAHAIGGNVKDATADLGVLRGEVDASLRKIDGLINEINRKWPFARDTEIRLP